MVKFQILKITTFEILRLLNSNNTTFNLSNFKSKSTIIPKFQELDSEILFFMHQYFYYRKQNRIYYSIFIAQKNLSIKSAQELFNRSFKQIYIIILAIVATMLLFTNEKNPKKFFFQNYYFFTGLSLNILSEVNAEFLDITARNNLLIAFMPIIIFFVFYFCY